MEGIFNILKAEGIELSDDVKKKINKSLSTEYKSIVEYSNLKKKLEDLSTQIQSQDAVAQEMETLKSKNEELNKLYEDSKTNYYKLQVLKSGINDRFVDFVTSEVKGMVNSKKDFNKALEEYKNDNPQFLNEQKKINISTTPTIGNKSELTDTNRLINDFIRRKL